MESSKKALKKALGISKKQIIQMFNRTLQFYIKKTLFLNESSYCRKGLAITVLIQSLIKKWLYLNKYV